MSRYQYEPREPAFEDYYRTVPRAQWEHESNKGMKQTVEEVYARGKHAAAAASRGRDLRREPEQEPEFESEAEAEASDDDDNDEKNYQVKYRRHIRRTRARSADSAKSRKSSSGKRSRSRSGSKDKGGELVRYHSRHRYETGPHDSSETEEEVYYSDEDDRRSSKSSRSSVSNSSDRNKALIKPVHKNAHVCGTHCSENANRPHGYKAPRAFPLPEDEQEYDSEEDYKQRKRRQRKRMLYTGLAGVATVAACNNVYQNTKAHKARRAALEHGMVCEAEAKNMRNKALLEDAIAVGVICVGMNNVFKGWKRAKLLKDQDNECHEKWMEKRNARDEKLGKLEG